MISLDLRRRRFSIADLQHRIFLLNYDGRLNSESPPLIPASPAKVLDIGCGTGVWTCAYAASHPGSRVIGADLEPPTRDLNIPNVRFVVADAEKDWSQIDQHLATNDDQDLGRNFDFIHARLLTYGIRDWDAFFRQCFAHLNPGGVLECTDACRPRTSKAGFDAEDSAFLQHMALVETGSESVGIDWNIHKHHGDRLRMAGFDVQSTKIFTWPVGQWSDTEKEREIGKLNIDNAISVMDGSPNRLTKFFPDMKMEEAIKLRDAAKQELRERCAELKPYTTRCASLKILPINCFRLTDLTALFILLRSLPRLKVDSIISTKQIANFLFQESSEPSH